MTDLIERIEGAGEGSDCPHVWITVTQSTYDIAVPYLRCAKCGTVAAALKSRTTAAVGDN